MPAGGGTPYSGGSAPFSGVAAAGRISRRDTAGRPEEEQPVRQLSNRLVTTVMTLALALWVPALGFAQTGAVAQALLIVPGQGIGPVRLGMTVAEVRAALGRELRSTGDPVTGTAVLAWKTSASGRLGVWFGTDGRATNVGVNLDPRYATAQGLRAGDAADKIRGVMGTPLDASSLPSATLGRLEVLRYPGIMFYIPSGARDAKLNGKVYSIIVGAGATQPAASAAPPAQTATPAPAQPAPATQPAAPPAPAPPVPAQPGPAPATAVPPRSVRVTAIHASPGDPTSIVPGRSIGAIRLGMKLADVTAIAGPSTDKEAAADGVTYRWADAPAEHGFAVHVTRGGAVNRVVIMDDARYTTAGGLRTGSTDPDIRAALGAPSSVTVDAASQRAMLRYDELGVWFEIQLDKQAPGYGTAVAIDIVAPGGGTTSPAGPPSPPAPEQDHPETGGQ